MTTCSVSEVLPTGQLSNVPWRRMGVKYTNNEAYFDVIEEIDAIIDKSGSTVFAEIQGYVSCMQRVRGGLMQPVRDDLKTLMYNATQDLCQLTSPPHVYKKKLNYISLCTTSYEATSTVIKTACVHSKSAPAWK